jgi:hypothetical protein
MLREILCVYIILVMLLIHLHWDFFIRTDRNVSF